MADCLENFLKMQDVKFYKSYNMKRISSIGIGGDANIVAIPNTKEKLVKIIEFAVDNGLNYKTVGKMTNILPCDNKYHGLLILTKDIKTISISENNVFADCGINLSSLINSLANKGLGGMSSLYGIPGSIGGAVCGNAGAYGCSISDFFIEGDFYSIRDKSIIRLSREYLNFSYRYSCIKEAEFIVLSACFKLNSVSIQEEKEKLKNTITRRRQSQPYGEMSLGSVFKRSGDIPISKLIDNLGLKGLSVGGAKISEKHAGFIVNAGNATAKNFLELVAVVKDKIIERYGIIPKLEIEILDESE